MRTHKDVYALLDADGVVQYIGISFNVEDRVRQHRKQGRINSPSYVVLQKSIPATRIFKAEQAWVAFFNDGCHTLLNRNRGGGGPFMHSQQAREKMSILKRGIKMPVRSAEHRRAISLSLTGRKNTQAHCESSGRGIKAAWREKPEYREKHHLALTGRKLSLEHRAKLREAKKGQVFTLDHRKKISTTLQGHIVTPETREKIRQALKGRILSAEHREKISLGLRKKLYAE